MSTHKPPEDSMTSSTLSKLLCAIICNKCLSPLPTPPGPLDRKELPVPANRPKFCPNFVSVEGGPRSDPFDVVNDDHEGKVVEEGVG